MERQHMNPGHEITQPIDQELVKAFQRCFSF